MKGETIIITQRCEHGVAHREVIALRNWANWATVDLDGTVRLWQKRPMTGVTRWVLDETGRTIEVHNLAQANLDQCSYPDWEKSLVDINKSRYPYYGRKIQWIKDLRTATGIGLRMGKFAVDCALACDLKGSREDFLKTVRFIVQLDQENHISIDRGTGPDSVYLDDVVSYLRGETKVEPFTQFTSDFFKGE